MQKKSDAAVLKGADGANALVPAQALRTKDIQPEKAKEAEEPECGLEELFAQAEELIARLEEPQLPLEEAFAAYEQGMKVIARCNGRIDAVEKKMLMMNEEGTLEPFEVSGGR